MSVVFLRARFVWMNLRNTASTQTSSNATCLRTSKPGHCAECISRKAPAGEAKLVRCVRGAVHDVVVDLRPESSTYRQSYAVELTMENRRALYIPESFGHGFQTLVDDTEVEYQMSEFHAPQHARGFRYDDAAFSIRWPRPVSMISAQDLKWPPFS